MKFNNREFKIKILTREAKSGKAIYLLYRFQMNGKKYKYKKSLGYF